MQTPEVGALAAWQAEIAAGTRSKSQFDELWRAACLEARARDCDRDGQHGAANEDRLAAAQLLVATAEGAS